MEKRPLVPIDLVIQEVKCRICKVTMAMMNPKDMAVYPVQVIRVMIGGTEILPSEEVERGYLYIHTKALR